MNKSIGDREGKAFAEKVLDHMRDRIASYQEETGDIFNLEATPAEFTAHKLARQDKVRFPDIITSGEAPGWYYTNSTNLPVDTKLPLGGYIKHQNEILPLYTGGSVFHIWGNESVPYWEGVSKLLRRVAVHSKISYYTYYYISLFSKLGFFGIRSCRKVNSRCLVE